MLESVLNRKDLEKLLSKGAKDLELNAGHTIQATAGKLSLKAQYTSVTRTGDEDDETFLRTADGDSHTTDKHTVST